jgi:hypothetical protein
MEIFHLSFKIVLAITGCIFSVQSTAMTVSLKRVNDASFVIDAQGPIVAGDAAKLDQLYAREFAARPVVYERQPMNRALRLNTTGGDLNEAMRIGRWARGLKMAVIVQDASVCLSSCVYILAAGLQKHPYGDIGIHRPYLVAAPAGGADKVMKQALRLSQEYFVEMNTPAQLAEDMFSTAPDDMKLLGDASLSKYRLNQDDIGFSEETDLSNASRLGMTRSLYLAKWKQFKKDSRACYKVTDQREQMECIDHFLTKNGLNEIQPR